MYMRLQKLVAPLIFFVMAFLLSGCFVTPNTYPTVAPGYWRGVLMLEGKSTEEEVDPDEVAEDFEFEEVTEGQLPFVMEINYDEQENLIVEVINGEERFRADSIMVGHNKVNGDDTLKIIFTVFNTHIIAKYEESIMQGYFVDNNRADYRIPFTARYGQNHRFTQLRKTPTMDISGKWETTFGVDGDDPYPAIGEFQQKDNHLSGTFLTETGDFRFLEGSVQANKLYLSCFDGAHAFLFEGKILEDQTIIGSFKSGTHYKTLWEAKQNPDATLADPDTLTYLNPGYETIDFTFPNTAGKMVSINDERYQDKVKIIQIMGTWCPNCKDETEFIRDYLEQNKNDDLEFIALAFERKKEKTEVMRILNKFKEKYDVPYEVLWAGFSNKKEAALALPMLNHVLSYPTMIFIDKNNKVRKIHTGFAGPATSAYTDFKKDFNQFTAALLQE